MTSLFCHSLNRALCAALPALVLAVTGCGEPAVPDGAVVEVNTYNFRSIVIKNKRPVLVEFWSHDCVPCKELEPKLVSLARENEGLVVAKVNSDENEAIAQDYGVHLVPTLFVFQDGEIMRRHTGAASDKELAELIAPYVRSK